MKISRLGIFVLVIVSALLGSSCSFYYRVMARKNLVNGAKAYNERKFKEAEDQFRIAIEYDSEGDTFESRTAQLFLARTLHSGFAGDRSNQPKARAAIAEYKKAATAFNKDLKRKREALAASPKDEALRKELETTENTVGSIVRSVASLYENLQEEDNWKQWQLKQANDAELPAVVRANSLVGLAAKQYTCANDITDSKDVKRTVKVAGESTFEFKKPDDNEDFDKDFEKLKDCVEEGMSYIDNAIKLNPESDSAWSYRTSLLVQKSRIAEMDGDNAKKDEYRKASDEAKKKFEALAAKKRKKDEEEARKKSEEAKKLSGGGESDDKKKE